MLMEKSGPLGRGLGPVDDYEVLTAHVDDEQSEEELVCRNCERKVVDLGSAVDDSEKGLFCNRECMWSSVFGGLKKKKNVEERRRHGKREQSKESIRRQLGPSLMDLEKMRAVEDLEDDEYDLNAMFVYHALMAQSYTLLNRA
ncbi:hypothetical protein NDN08_005381 [Rhodosorus marinus]|uniref:Uncharacterized protein n=1 Tax=Rhodosorus marinus TaxID=101924 RepID=A0AAV8V1G7_9RHOD|nr:hypothetical protein NDN08_005381 [Rhodosorus marinus]